MMQACRTSCSCPICANDGGLSTKEIETLRALTRIVKDDAALHAIEALIEAEKDMVAVFGNGDDRRE